MNIVNPGHYSCVYQIRNLVNGKVYVGSAVDYMLRFWQHQTSLRAGNHHSDHLQKSYNKYGEDNFIIEPLECVSVDILIKSEQIWIDKLMAYPNGYNVCPKAENCLGRIHSEETKQKISKSNMGKVVVHSAETRMKLSIANIGKHIVSDETRVRISLATKGKPKKGHPISEETKIKLIDSRKGKPGTPWTEERKERESVRMMGNVPGNKGVPITEEHRKNIIDGLKIYYSTHNKVISQEQGEKLSQSAIRRYENASLR